MLLIHNRGNSALTILDEEDQNTMLMLVSFYGSHLQLIVILSALRNDKDISFLLLDSPTRLYYPLFRTRILHVTR